MTEAKRTIELGKVIVFFKIKLPVLLLPIIQKGFSIFCSLPNLCEIVGEYICTYLRELNVLYKKCSPVVCVSFHDIILLL